ncbi:MAG: hypothetical protein ACR2JT_08505 [Nocardioidaceae bacterium]
MTSHSWPNIADFSARVAFAYFLTIVAVTRRRVTKSSSILDALQRGHLEMSQRIGLRGHLG